MNLEITRRAVRMDGMLEFEPDLSIEVMVRKKHIVQHNRDYRDDGDEEHSAVLYMAGDDYRAW